jgi:uracil-DNA glycosylase family protein
MVKNRAPVPDGRDLGDLARAARGCTACNLHANATQTVFGEGRHGAAMMLVGEQPGDQEDRRGRPFVGPAGRLLDRVLEAAGIARDDVYVTNAVKHFKWVPASRGERRIHKTPNGLEIAACRPWLEAEIDAVEPAVIVALGAIAAQTLFGKQFRVTREHGRLFRLPGGRLGSATVHPASILRAADTQARELSVAAMIDDLVHAARGLAEVGRRT